jgi:outer membrane protein assembly factor BamB
MLRTLPRSLAAIAIGCSLLSAANWLTFGGDPQRSGWAKDETLLTKDNAKNIQLDWKIKLENEAKELNALTPAVTLDGVITPHGFKEYVIVGGSSDNLYAVDTESGKVVWQKHFTNAVPPPSSPPFWLCPQALNDTPVILTGKFMGRTVFVISIDGKLHALNINNGEDRFPPTQFVPPYSKNWSLNLLGTTIYTSISQGCGGAKSGVWAMDLKSADKKPTFFEADSTGGGIWGRGGPTIGADGTVYVETGDGPYDPGAGKYSDSFLALSPDTLKLRDYYTPSNQQWITRKDLDMGNITPVVFPYKGRELIVGAGKEGTLFMLDAKSLGGETHRKPLYRSQLLTNEDVDFAGRGFWGAFATWQDPQGTRWVYAPAWGPVHSKAPAFAASNGPTPNGSIMAFKVEDKDGQPVLTPAWISRDMNVPEPPVVADGVVFAVSSGEFVRQAKDSGALYTSKERAENAVGNATLYAFDAQTGKELYSSSKTMPSFSHFGGLAVSNGHIYVSTHDSTLYSFGVKAE